MIGFRSAVAGALLTYLAYADPKVMTQTLTKKKLDKPVTELQKIAHEFIMEKAMQDPEGAL